MKDFFSVENLSVKYGEDNIINNLSMNLSRGSLTALLGLNGTGKTSIIKAICGLIPSSSTKMQIGNRDIKNLNNRKRSEIISYVPQKSNFEYSITSLDVVAMGFNPSLKIFETPSKKQLDYARLILDELGLKDKIDCDYKVLSGGQQQLVILARAMVQNSLLMLFDEPDSALDFPNRHMIMEKITSVLKNNNSCGLITLHDPNYALTYCETILILNGGEIVGSINVKESNKYEIQEQLSLIYNNISIIEYKNQFVLLKDF
ncbi:MAG: ABC transporter ATP-binding protein [Clostridium sp.]